MFNFIHTDDETDLYPHLVQLERVPYIGYNEYSDNIGEESEELFAKYICDLRTNLDAWDALLRRAAIIHNDKTINCVRTYNAFRFKTKEDAVAFVMAIS